MTQGLSVWIFDFEQITQWNASVKGVRYLRGVLLRPVNYPTLLAHGLRRSLLEGGISRHHTSSVRSLAVELGVSADNRAREAQRFEVVSVSINERRSSLCLIVASGKTTLSDMYRE